MKLWKKYGGDVSKNEHKLMHSDRFNTNNTSHVDICMWVWLVDVGHKIMNVLEHTPSLFPTLSPYFFHQFYFL